MKVKKNGKVYGSTNTFMSEDIDMELFTKFCKERLKFITDEIKEIENE